MLNVWADNNKYMMAINGKLQKYVMAINGKL